MIRIVALVATLAVMPACDNERRPATGGGIVTLAPHLTELVYAAGAGDLLVGVSAWSDHPAEAKSLPVVSDAFTVDQEQLAILAPDFILAWDSGTPAHVVDELARAGYRVEVVRTRGLADVAAALEQIGALTGRVETAGPVAEKYRADLAALESEFASLEPLSVFYQVSMRPLYTINGEHYIGEIITLCGGRNVFADVGELAPAVSVEAVLDRNPEVLLAGSADGSLPFSEWLRWPEIAANRYGNHFVVDADAIGRPSTRLVDAAAAVCRHLETGRENRATANRGG